MLQLIGKSIGHYLIIEELGIGRSTATYKARDNRLEREVVIKVLRREVINPEIDDQIVKKFEKQVKILSKISHPNIAPILDYGNLDGFSFFVMPYLTGGTLRQKISGNIFTAKEALRILTSAARVLDYAHTHGLVHGAVTPSNILISETGEAVLTDFGLVEALANGNYENFSTANMGSDAYEYLAPEQRRGLAVAASDQYALGVILYEMLTGRRPFAAKNSAELNFNQPEASAVHLSRVGNELSSDIENLVRKMLAKNPEDRFPAMSNVIQAFEAILHETPDGECNSGQSRSVVPEMFLMDDDALNTRSESAIPDTAENLPEGKKVSTEKKVSPLLWGGLGIGFLIVMCGILFGLIFGGRELFSYLKGENRPGADASKFVSLTATIEPTQPLIPTPTPTEIQPVPNDFANLSLGSGEVRFGKGQIEQLSVSPNGSVLGVASYTGLYIYDTKTYEVLQTMDGGNRIHRFAFSPRGDLIASASFDNVLSFWDVFTGKRINVISNSNTNDLEFLAFSSDGKTLIGGTGADEVVLWDVDGGTELRRIPIGDTWWSKFALSPDTQILAVFEDDAGVSLWNLVDGNKVRTLNTGDGLVYDLAFSPDGSTIAVVESALGDVELWSIKQGQKFGSIGEFSSSAVRAQYSPDGEILAVGLQSGEVILWDTENQIIRATLNSSKDDIHSLAFLPDGQALVAAQWNGTINIWNIADGSLSHTLEGFTYDVRSLAFSPDGDILASGSRDGSINLFDTRTYEKINTLRKHSNQILSLAFSPDGTQMASGSSDSLIIIWDVAAGEMQKVIKWNDAGFTNIAYSPDGSILASGTDKGEVILWDAVGGKQLEMLTGHSERIRDIAFSSDGILATGSFDDLIIFWDVSNGTKIAEINSDEYGGVNSLAFSPTENILASGTLRGVVNIWNTKTYEILASAKINDGESLNSLAFSPDGSVLACGSDSGDVTLWNFDDNQMLTLLGHKADVNDVIFSPDGRELASGSYDGTVIIWNVTK